MEEYQKEKINQHLVHMIQRTTCSTPFLAEFQQKGVLSNSDVVTLEVEGNNRGYLQQSKKFYEIIQTRRNAYEVLLEALRSTSQNGALTLLENEDTEPGKKASKTISYVSPPKYLPDFLRGSISTLVIHTPDCEISRSRIIETVPNVIEYSPKSFVDSVPTTSSKSSYSTQQEFPLINCQHGIDHIKYSLKNTKKKIVLLPNKLSEEIHELQVRLQCKKVQHENDELEWDDLHPSMQISVEENLKSFQLSVDCDVTLSKLKGKVLFELIKGNKPTLFKNTIPPKINYYVPRRLITRNIISKKVFQSGGRDLFLIKGIKRHELTEIANGQETDTSSNLIEKNSLGSIKFALLDYDSDYDRIVDRIGGERPIHVFQFHEDKLTWVKSSGGIYSIQGAVDSSQKMLTEDEFLENIVNSQTNKNDPVCISDSPGMGKSVLLASIGHMLQQSATNFWHVGLVVISELVENTKKYANQPDLKKQVTSFLEKNLSENELGAAYFQGHTNELTNLLLDGLDELQAENVLFGNNLLTLLREVLPNTRIWVTTRPHMFANLEQTLNVLGYNILAFEENDQVNFLNLYWSRESPSKIDPQTLKTFAQSCLSTIKSQINSDREQDIAGIPLQCLLIGEVFEDDALRFGTTTEINTPKFSIKSVTDLYEQLVKKKFNKFYERYDKNNCGYVDLTKEHIFYSLWLLFPAFRDKFGKEYRSNPLSIQAVFNVGILESKTVLPSPRFIHRTFAEYFVAKFVVDALSSPLTANLFNLLYKNILKTKRVAQRKFGKANVSSRQFVHNVVCYFIDSLIGKTGGVNCKDELSTKCSNFKLEQWKQLCEGCAYSSFEHILQHLVCRVPSFAKFEKEIFTEEFVVISTLFSDATMATKVYERFKASDKDLSKILWQDYSLVQLAVIRGNYKLFEKNAAMIKQSSFQDSEFCWSLVRDCVTESKSNSNRIIKEKIEILDYLLRTINNSQFSLKFQKYDDFFSSNSNIDLAIKIVECTDVTEKGTKKLIHKATSWYNCKDYRRLLRSLCSKVGSSIDKMLNEEKFITAVMKNLDLNPKFLQFLKDIGSNINVFEMLNDEKLVRKSELKRQTNILTSNLKKVLDSENPQLDESENTWLHTICMSTINISERLKIIQHLIDKGADLNAKNNSSETPIDILSKHNVTKEGLQIMNLMEKACGNMQENFFLKINWLVKGIEEMKFKDYADICSKVTVTQPITDKNGNTLLHLVAKLNDYLAIEHLLSLGVDVNAQNLRKDTPLHVAIQNDQISLQNWKVWINNGADPCLVDIDNETPIYKLCRMDNKLELIEYSMNHALQVHSTKLEEIFLLALSFWNSKDIKILCVWFTENIGASLCSVQGNFKSSLASVLDAALHNTEDGNVLEYIVETQKCQTALLPLGYVWFYKSLTKWHMHDDTKFLKVVNKLFPDLINTPDQNGLHSLSTNGIASNAARALIRLGANVNDVDKFGNTPLLWALKHSRYNCDNLVDTLVKGGADVNAVTNNGETPLLLSLKIEDTDRDMIAKCFIILIQHDADLRRDFSFDNTILHQVVKNVWSWRLPDVMEVLLKKGYHDLLQFSDMNNQTPIQIAQQRYQQDFYRNDKLIKMFREYGVQI